MADIPEIESRWTDVHFNQVFEQVMSANPDWRYWQAYEETENRHVALFGQIRYKSYDSFRNCRKKMLFGN
jgi:hypothetical protein